ncbi:MAG: DegV family EDD domain-containing protein [Actinobacteria bacterium]|nr:MAG: DegV family EDD domain-containing protein [Actinomycetota bacterium]
MVYRSEPRRQSEHERRTMKTRIVTDSAANIPPDLVAEHDIHVVPMYLKFGESVYQDGVDLPPGEFYPKLEREEVPVSTAAPSAGDYREAFERALRGAQGVVCVTVASFVSVSYEAARAAAVDLVGRVRLIDSKSASMGEGWAAIEAARRAASGAGVDECAARAEEIASRTQLCATINTFEFLRRSGRVHRPSRRSHRAARASAVPVSRDRAPARRDAPARRCRSAALRRRARRRPRRSARSARADPQGARLRRERADRVHTAHGSAHRARRSRDCRLVVAAKLRRLWLTRMTRR